MTRREVGGYPHRETPGPVASVVQKKLALLADIAERQQHLNADLAELRSHLEGRGAGGNLGRRVAAVQLDIAIMVRVALCLSSSE